MNDKYYENGHEESDGFVALTGEDGNVEKFYHVGTIDFKDDWYVFFQPAEPKDGVDPDELVVFKLSGDERNETLLPVKDEKLLEELFEEFARQVSGLQIEKMWITGDVREGRGDERWLNILLRKTDIC